jgi:Protein of Unknown function (DUF2784)
VSIWLFAARGILVLHLLWILWVIAGALFTRRRLWLAWAHVGSLVYGIFIELSAWPCPLTLLEQALQRRAGLAAYQGDFLTHWLEAIIYPDLAATVLAPAAVAVCGLNLAVYAIRLLLSRKPAARHPLRS